MDLAVACLAEFKPAGLYTFFYGINKLPTMISSINLAADLVDLQLLKLI